MRAHAALGELRESEQRLANAQRLARIGDWEWETGESEMLWSAQLHEILAVPHGSAVPTLELLLARVHPADRAAVEKALESARAEAKGFRLDHRVLLASGEERVVRQDVEVGVGPSDEVERLT